MRRMRFYLTVVAFFASFVIVDAQSTFNPVVYTQQSEDLSLLQNSIRMINERNYRYEKDYSEAMVKYSDAVMRDEYTMALVYIDECIRVNNTAEVNGHRIEDASRLYEKKAETLFALERNEDCADAYLDAMKYCGDAARALSYARLACELSPKEESLCSLAVAFSKAGYEKEALDLSKRLSEGTINGNVKYSMYRLAADIKTEGRLYEEAIELYEKILKLKPDSLADHVAYGNLKYSAGDLDGAIEKWEDVLFSFNMGEYDVAAIKSSIYKAKYRLARNVNDKKGMNDATKGLKRLSKLVPKNLAFLESIK